MIVRRFAAEARSDGKLPIVLMIQDGSSGDRLQSALQPVLDEDAILSLNTNSICPTSDRSYFLPDSHFTPAGDRMIAEAIAKLIRAHTPCADRRRGPLTRPPTWRTSAFRYHGRRGLRTNQRRRRRETT